MHQEKNEIGTSSNTYASSTLKLVIIPEGLKLTFYLAGSYATALIN